MAPKTKVKQKQANAFKRINEALLDGRKAQRRLAELSDALDQKLPPEDFAELLVKTVKDTEANSKDRMMCLGYIISIKKFHEKNDRKIEDEDFDSLSRGQIGALLASAGNLSITDAMQIVNADESIKSREVQKSQNSADAGAATPDPQAAGQAGA